MTSRSSPAGVAGQLRKGSLYSSSLLVSRSRLRDRRPDLIVVSEPEGGEESILTIFQERVRVQSTYVRACVRACVRPRVLVHAPRAYVRKVLITFERSERDPVPRVMSNEVRQSKNGSKSLRSPTSVAN
ncbi:hypothetical protein EVAR_60434_1 [Eumeta japonica]|uniref:Uncharacterized protein n=1 Tax=Eumeta variegata TaxID=151549 RepID=A0A4C1ZPM6_EUMVA|nr:hypothetical protein EVAR_60434_1 [Eumeta japonica]